MLDKYFCKKIGKKEISLCDICDYISSIYGNTIAELSIIGLVFIAAVLICIGARDGFFTMLAIGISGFIMGCIVSGLIFIISKYIHVATCPLKKQ